MAALISWCLKIECYNQKEATENIIHCFGRISVFADTLDAKKVLRSEWNSVKLRITKNSEFIDIKRNYAENELGPQK